MKKNLINSILSSLALFMLLLLASCKGNDDHAGHQDVYTCPMHPTVLSDKPGTCPVCGMDLVRKAQAGEEVEISGDLSKLIKSPDQVIISSIRTIKAEYKSVPVFVDAAGMVTYDTRNVYSVPARAGGRIEKMYLKYEFQAVKKGQKIAELYSPELVTAQRELLYLLENDDENDLLIQSAKHKLELLGLTTSQINDMVKRKEPHVVFTVYSPYSGYVILDDMAPSVNPEMNQTSSAAGGAGMSAMGPAAPAASSPSVTPKKTSLIREGDYVSAGETLVRLVNTNGLRIELEVPGADAGIISAGDKIKLDFGDGNESRTSVDFVQPFFSEGQNFMKIRVYIKDKDLFIGQLVRARIQSGPRESLWIPRQAVLDLGTDKVVFIKQSDVFKPRKIVTGARADELIEVETGLASSEEIAANAQYLVDSESFIKIDN